tara:strand:+ start:69 stop:263 length:195 start_codon:yes stop_codon:yes gene_type:complete
MKKLFLKKYIYKEDKDVRKLLYEYAVDNRGEDDLRGVIKVFAELIEMSYDELIEELKWIKKDEN